MNDCLRAGFASRDITPPPGGMMDGFAARAGAAVGTCDPLFVKSAFFSDGQRRHLILSFDLCGANEELAIEIIKGVCGRSNLPRQSVSLAFTHTHSGPACGLLKGIPFDAAYWKKLADLAAECAEEAIRGAFDVRIAVTRGELGFPVNRRELKDRKIILGETDRGYVDKSARVLCVYRVPDTDVPPAGVIAHASCHPTCLDGGNLFYSADYPGAFYKEITKAYPESTAVFINGGAGDVAPSRQVSETGFDHANRCGGELAGAVLNAARGIAGTRFPGKPAVESALGYACVSYRPLPSLAGLKSELSIRLAAFEAASAPGKPEYEKYIAGRYFKWYENAVRRKEAGEERPQKSVPVQVLKLCGQIIFIMLPFEVFSSTTEKLVNSAQSAGYDPNCVFVCGYANGVYGYLSPGYALAEGGYEAEDSYYWYDLPGPYTGESEEEVIKTAERLLRI